MSANGTPQSYLSKNRNSTTTSNYRDYSMEQNNTGSGNPYGYTAPQLPPQSTPQQYPDNRYIPPSYDPNTGQWSQAGKTYSLPTAYTPNGGGGLPTGPQAPNSQQFMPGFGSPQPGASIAPGGSMSQFNNHGYTAPNFGGGNAQPPAISAPQQQSNMADPQGALGANQWQSNQQQSGSTGNALANYATALQSVGLGKSNSAVMPQFTSGNDTYMQSPPGAHSTEPPPKKNLMFHAPPGTPGGAMPAAPGSQGGGASGFLKPNILGMPSGLMPGIPGFGSDGMTQWEKSTRPPVTHTSGIVQRNNDPYADDAVQNPNPMMQGIMPNFLQRAR